MCELGRQPFTVNFPSLFERTWIYAGIPPPPAPRHPLPEFTRYIQAARPTLAASEAAYLRHAVVIVVIVIVGVDGGGTPSPTPTLCLEPPPKRAASTLISVLVSPMNSIPEFCWRPVLTDLVTETVCFLTHPLQQKHGTFRCRLTCPNTQRTWTEWERYEYWTPFVLQA